MRLGTAHDLTFLARGIVTRNPEYSNRAAVFIAFDDCFDQQPCDAVRRARDDTRLEMDVIAVLDRFANDALDASAVLRVDVGEHLRQRAVQRLERRPRERANLRCALEAVLSDVLVERAHSTRGKGQPQALLCTLQLSVCTYFLRHSRPPRANAWVSLSARNVPAGTRFAATGGVQSDGGCLGETASEVEGPGSAVEARSSRDQSRSRRMDVHRERPDKRHPLVFP